MKNAIFILSALHPAKEADKHFEVLFSFIEFIYNKEVLCEFEQITAGVVKTKFRTFFIKSTNRRLDEKDCRSILKGFFTFIYKTYGRKNDKVMKVFERE